MQPRSWLFVPGDDSRKLEKSPGTGADALILDLEDSVSPAHKDAARETAAGALRRPAPMPRWVRVNALDTGRTAGDVAATLPAGAAGFVLPKCEGREDIEALSAMIAEAGGGEEIGILVIATETAGAVRGLLTSDWRHPRLVGMAWGGEDLAADLGVSSNRDETGAYRSPFRFARDAMLFAAKAAGVTAVDSVFIDLRDPEGLAAEAGEAAAVGFGAKLAIHPGQIEAIHRAFTPGEAQVAWARRVLQAMEEARGGVAQLDGRMVDEPHLKSARAILARLPAA